MAHFDPIELEWHGVNYRLEGDGKIMAALAAVEDHITIAELVQGQNSGRLPLAKLSRAYAALLRSAGCRVVTDADVYAGMWDGGVDRGAITSAIDSLMSMMVPPSTIGADDSEEDDPEGAEDVGKRPTPAKSKGGGSSKRGKRG